jgi:GNAT superfamily N-acetyltransferase
VRGLPGGFPHPGERPAAAVPRLAVDGETPGAADPARRGGTGTLSAPGATFRLVGGAQAAPLGAELRALQAEVFADPPYLRADDPAVFDRRFAVQRRQPGFVLAEARHGGYLLGYAAGMPLRPSTSWWRGLTAPLPDEVTAEHPGRTFALTDLLVRASWRRQGIARELHDLILAGRPEERATLTVLPAAAAAQSAFRNWGWRKVGRTRDSLPGWPVADVLVLTPLARSGGDRR